MFSIVDRLRGAAGFASGVLIGLSMITPVFAATSPGLETWTGPLVLAALGLLAAGIGLDIVRGDTAGPHALCVQCIDGTHAVIREP